MSEEDMLGSSSDQWLQYYDLETIPEQPTLAVTATATATATVSPSGSATTSASSAAAGGGVGGRLSPKGGCISKPVQRRSRVSKRTPITLLNANTSNFRALVQQYTGSRSSTWSFGGNPRGRGPLNLSFAAARSSQGNGALVDDHDDGATTNSAFVHNYLDYQQSQTRMQELQQQLYQDQQCMFPFEDSKNPRADDCVYPSTCSNPAPNVQALDDFFLENNSLYQLIGDA